MKRQHQLYTSVLVVLAATGTAAAQAPAPEPAPAPAPEPTQQPAPEPAQQPAPEPAQQPAQNDSDQVSCPPDNPNESSAACPKPDTQPQPAQAMPAPVPTEPSAPLAGVPPQEWYDIAGMALSVGGGVEDFAGSTLRNTTATGGSWDARLTIGTRYWVAGELSYIGSAQSVHALGLSSSTMVGNGAQAALRLNATMNYPFQPFVYGGAAWRHYSLSSSGVNLSDIASSADVFELPVGVGFAAYYSNLMLDVRGEYRFAWGGGDFVPTPNGGNASLDRWGVSGNIGFEF